MESNFSEVTCELRLRQVPLVGSRFAEGRLIAAKGLHEIEMPEFTAVDLGQTGIETLQYPRQTQGLQQVLGPPSLTDSTHMEPM